MIYIKEDVEYLEVKIEDWSFEMNVGMNSYSYDALIPHNNEDLIQMYHTALTNSRVLERPFKCNHCDKSFNHKYHLVFKPFTYKCPQKNV